MARKPAADTATLETNGIAPEDFLAHYRRIRDTKRAKEEAGAAHNAAKQQAKAAGIDLNALKIVEHLASLDDADAELRMRETLRYANWMGLEVGTQVDMFDAPAADLTGKVASEHKEWKAEQDGYEAGKKGEPIDNNPFPGGSPFYSRWRSGWNDGQAFLASKLAPKGDAEA